MMKKTILSLFIVLGVSAICRATDTLLLFHPTAYNLELVKTLIDEELFPLSNFHIQGVFHKDENYDYQLSAIYLYEHPDSRLSIQKVEGELEAGKLWQKNACSKQFETLFRSSKGALFMGGPDIPPHCYGEELHLLTSVTDPYRHYMELSYLFHLLGSPRNKAHKPWMQEKPDYLISGICLGMQTMHVASGGTMIQDIPSEVYGLWTVEDILDLPPDQMHSNYGARLSHDCSHLSSYHFHKIRIEEGTFIDFRDNLASTSAGIRTPLVLSSHHQALENLQPGWTVAAWSDDGRIIEAIEHRRYPHVFGVQFHPEKPGLFDPSIKHRESCGTEASFAEHIRNDAAYSFHRAYWKKLGKILMN